MVIFILYTLILLGLGAIKIDINPSFGALILFSMAEFAFYLSSGSVSLFGLFEKQSIVQTFRVERDIAISMSGAISVIVYLLYVILMNTKQSK